ncbi:restriction endonuclease subunit S [Tenacibaculum finnmarkense]|uniref:restriction endonuclease subunit S n=1 Tax=Tenacibaculum finnmarkense TaxID=2781243 RepID=UPI001EFAF27C|nr:restriction endonuclease subunit S [Tenacibaculum finnmarkense]MCG8883012.1 restriction endonuclease subunit S [Tenacibaculum finnmarkense]
MNCKISEAKSNYRKIGDFIQLVDERNKDLKVTKLLGLSISKQFIPSVANTIGTNMKNYKIIRKNQFACSTMQVRRDKKMPIALLQDFEEAIISQAYPVFKIIDETILNSEYLMMWFSRSEFDRHACFLAIGGVRGSLEWEDFLEMPIPVPSIEKQHEIVKEYNTVANRITLNETINKKLEDTAQALYKNWFVDFEFPNEQGKPYKSNGGKMVFNEELDLEIPLGWESKSVNKEFNIQIGRTPPRHELNWFTKDGKGLKWISIKDLGNNGSHILTTSEKLTFDAVKKFKIPIIPKNKTILSFKMSIGKVAITNEEMLSNEAIAHFIQKKESFISSEFIYCFLSSFNFNSLGTTSSIVNSINSKMVKELIITVPNESIINIFNSIIESVFKKKLIIEKQNNKLSKLKNLLLSKMSKVAIEKEMVC